MAHAKYTRYKYIKLADGSWRYCRAAMYVNRTVKRDIVLVGGKEEQHSDGDYFLYHTGHWIPAGPDALASPQQHALLSGNAVEYEPLAGRPMLEQRDPRPQAQPAGGDRKKIKGEIDAYLDNLILSKRPAKTVRMKRNFLVAFAALIGKEHTDEYRREDVLVFRNSISRSSASRSTLRRR
jgi:hypothetical protein